MITPTFDQPMLSLSPHSIDRIHNVDDLGAMWTVFTKCKAHLENGERLENMSWRLWYHEKQLLLYQSEQQKQQQQRKSQQKQQEEQEFDDYFSYIPPSSMNTMKTTKTINNNDNDNNRPSLETCSSSSSSTSSSSNNSSSASSTYTVTTVSSHTSFSFKRFISLLSPAQDVWSHQPATLSAPTNTVTAESHDRHIDTNQQAPAELYYQL
ncbi:hypothetical protein BDC45DRAFT_553821 [Circinella umbellata]|nr:hypothetical protein BDC45DRAFT_553821 [Circinella umbellata]